MQIGIDRIENNSKSALCAAATNLLRMDGGFAPTPCGAGDCRLRSWAVPTGDGIALEYRCAACFTRPPGNRQETEMPKINRDGVQIYYEVHGSGPPLLLTHGYSSTAQMWQGQIEALSEHHKLVLWDMRGHGRSDYPGDASAYSEA